MYSDGVEVGRIRRIGKRKNIVVGKRVKVKPEW